MASACVATVKEYVGLVWKWSSANAQSGVGGEAYFITIYEELQRNQGCYFPHASALDIIS